MGLTASPAAASSSKRGHIESIHMLVFACPALSSSTTGGMPAHLNLADERRREAVKRPKICTNSIFEFAQVFFLLPPLYTFITVLIARTKN